MLPVGAHVAFVTVVERGIAHSFNTRTWKLHHHWAFFKDWFTAVFTVAVITVFFILIAVIIVAVVVIFVILITL